MIQLSTLLPPTPKGPIRPALLDAGASGFALPLGGLARDIDAPVALPTPFDPARQILAHAGKDLPVGSEDSAEDACAPQADSLDEDASKDVAIAWFVPVPSPAPEPQPFKDRTAAEGTQGPHAPSSAEPASPLLANMEVAPPAEAKPLDAPDAAPSRPGSTPAPECAAPETLPGSAVPGTPMAPRPPVPVVRTALLSAVTSRREQVEAGIVPSNTGNAAPAALDGANTPPPAESLSATDETTLQQLQGRAAPVAPVHAARVNPASPDGSAQAPEPADLSLAPAPRPLRFESQPAAPPAVAPQALPAQSPQPFAQQVFQHLVAGEARAPARRGPADPVRLDVATQGAEPLLPAAIAAPVEAEAPPLDTRRPHWVGQLAEQIEAMRDAAPARDTRIRLAPDALGAVDVAISQDGERIHVHFTAETAAARQMLHDAQPRLAELAEARGLRLGQASIDSGAAGQGSQGHQQAPARRSPDRPPSAREDFATPNDERVA